MLKYINQLVFILLFFSCGSDTHEENNLQNLNKNAKIESYNYQGIRPFLYKKDDKIHVINFWATWCIPCVEELPYFEKLGAEYADKNVEVILISMDFPDKVQSDLTPFIKENNIQSKVIVLDDPDANTWISKVDEDWTGAIPATIIYRNDQRYFYEQSFTYKELKTEVEKLINQN